MSERQTTGEFINYIIGKRGGKTYNQIQEMAKEIGRLQKENQKLRDVKNKAIGHINCCKTSLGNYLLSPSEVECLLDILKEGDIE